MKSREILKSVFAVKAFDAGRKYESGYYNLEYSQDELQLLVDLWIEITDEDFHETCEWIKESHINGCEHIKKRYIAKRNEMKSELLA